MQWCTKPALTNPALPSRIVCLTEETTETLYLLGEERRIVGISGYTVRPARARREKPRVSAFTSARTDKILALRPDLVIGFSDMQADIARDLINLGLNVLVFNQRSVVEILGMIRTLAALVGATERGDKLIFELGAGLERIRGQASRFGVRPRVYFEEWDEPMISGIGWVSELVRHRRSRRYLFGARTLSPAPAAASSRTRTKSCGARPTSSSAPGAARNSGPRRCGRERAGASSWRCATTNSSRSSPWDILQPGPAALTDGVSHLHERIAAWVESRPGARS